MTTRLNDPIRTTTGEITTIAALDAAGKIIFRMSPNFNNRKNPTYFADLKEYDGEGSSSGWEISRLAYLSRTRQPVTLTVTGYWTTSPAIHPNRNRAASGNAPQNSPASMKS